MNGCRHPLVTELSLYDIVGTEGVAVDISHINTGAKVWTSLTAWKSIWLRRPMKRSRVEIEEERERDVLN